MNEKYFCKSCKHVGEQEQYRVVEIGQKMRENARKLTKLDFCVCRKNPPTHIVDHDEMPAYWPPVDQEYDWCSEHTELVRDQLKMHERASE